MYPSSGHHHPGLTRYGSAPGSLLASIADSVLSDSDFVGSGSGPDPRRPPGVSRFFGEPEPPPPPSESGCHVAGVGPTQHQHQAVDPRLGGSTLARHSSSPAGFFSHLVVDNGFSVTNGLGHYPQPSSNGVHAMPSTMRSKSQLSFSRQEPLSQISEIGITDMGESVVGGNNSDETAGNVGQSYIPNNYQIGSWDDANSIAFSAPSSKRAKDCNEDLLNSLSGIDSQFGLPTSLEMASVEKLLQAQQDSVAFKVRAKRGCATHPRSIAERERRTKISEKLRKLQELVPNMDKQTSTSDMLDLAVEHIKKLQSQVQNLNQERASCTCACKEEDL
ncbi:putative serine/threonine-protein kinase [Iris pallida]|uniref:Serine/threonine-protein kinase n=1 Tax=Iris pallida TaxID=29817 RepID=A0AAX6FXN9_IRIPA|nr:putative serine/threonine-protein kinase [Iris pallida]